MIIIEAKANQRKHTLKLTVKGHAGAADAGEDLICAAASAYTYQFAQVIKNYEGTGKIDQKRVKLLSGDATISCRATNDVTFRALYSALTVVMTGFKLLETNYRTFVKVV